MSLEIRDFTLDYDQPFDQPAQAVTWRDGSTGDLETFLGRRRDGEDAAALLVRLGVDGMFDIVEHVVGRSDAVEVVERSIAALEHVRSVLAALPGRLKGQCMAQGDWGRCHLDTGHDLPHVFPSKEEWTELNNLVEQGAHA